MRLRLWCVRKDGSLLWLRHADYWGLCRDPAEYVQDQARLPTTVMTSSRRGVANRGRPEASGDLPQRRSTRKAAPAPTTTVITMVLHASDDRGGISRSRRGVRCACLSCVSRRACTG